MSSIVIPVKTHSTDVVEDLEIIASVQEIVKNLTVDNLKLLAKKSQKANINKKIQQFKHMM